MFTLRIIEKTRTSKDFAFDEVVENFALGNSYSILIQGLTKEFNKIMEEKYAGVDRSIVKGLLIRELDGDIFFIYNKDDLQEYTYYILTDGGKTFDRI